MTESLPSVEEVFADALRALAAAGDAAVAIGGWAVRLLREHPRARQLSHAPLFTTDLDIALGANDPQLGELLHQQLESLQLRRRLEGDARPPVSAHVRRTRAGEVKVEFLMARSGAATARSGRSRLTQAIGGLTAQCFPTVRLLLLEPWRVPVALPDGKKLGIRVPNPTSLICEKLLIMGRRKNVQEQAKDLLYLAEVIAMFADEMGVLRALAAEHVWPALHGSEKRRIQQRLESLQPTSDVVLAAAAEARATGRMEWADPEVLAGLVQAGVGNLFEA